MRFHFIDVHRDVHRVRGMCSVLEVSPSDFYAWKRREPCRTVQDDGKLVAESMPSFRRADVRTASRGSMRRCASEVTD